MAVDKNKISAEATRLVQKGQFDKAIRAYQKILGDDPGDVRVLLKIGELQQKKGDSRAAAETFGRVAEAYGDQGFFLKAVAVYKQALKLAPDEVRINERLAQLYQQLGLVSEAMAQLQLIAVWAERTGDDTKLVESLRRVVELDPDNVAFSVKLGEVYARQNQPKLAVEHLRRAADQLKRNSRGDEYLKVAERIATLLPDDCALGREVASMLLARGETKRALAKLQHCYKLEPSQLETLTLLAQAFQDLGQTSKMTSVFKELARIHADAGNVDAAREAWRRVVDLAPDDPDALQALGDGAPAAAPSPPQATEAAPEPPAPVPAAPVREVAPATGPEIAKILTETDVYVKYGLHDKALEHLEKIFAADPDHLDAHEKAARIHVLRQDAARAAEEEILATRIALTRGLPGRARESLDRLRDLAPSHPGLAELESLLQADAAVELVAEDGDGVVLEIETPAAAGPDADDLALSAAVAPAEDEVESETESPPVREQDDESFEQDLAEVAFFITEGLVAEAREMLTSMLGSYPNDARVLAKLEELQRAPSDHQGARQRVPAAPGGDYLYSVKDVLEPFRKGIEQTVTAEDSETHYDLGIAYREMGLLDDALREFETALHGKRKDKEIDCLSMIGLCRLESGDAAGAIAAYRQALRADALTADLRRAVEYQIAAAYELAGDRDVAVHYLNRVVEGEPEYRDARASLERLGGGPGCPPPEDAVDPLQGPAGTHVGSA